MVVTFNRKLLLQECLEKLIDLPQVSKIYVIDNCSSDGTKDFLEDNGVLSSQKIRYRRLDVNTGGAGGFSECLKWAFDDSESDWFWLMDDDVEPVVGIVEKMLSYSQFSKCIHPSKIYLDGEIFSWEGWLNVNTGVSSWYHDAFRKTDKPFTVVNYGCFEGMFIHREIVSKIGFPDKRFFIHDDDLVYGLLASQYTNVLYLKDIGLIKKIKKVNQVKRFGITLDRSSSFNEYFNIRNHFLINEYLVNNFSARPIVVRFFLCLKILKRIAEAVIFDLPNTETLKMLFYGLYDGLFGNFEGHKRFLS